MKKRIDYLKFLHLVLIIGLITLSSCLENSGTRKVRAISIDNPSKDSNNGDGSSGDRGGNEDGDNAGAIEGGDPGNFSEIDALLEHGRAELRHLVDPFDGTYKTKLTLPKNFTGLLYLSGLNITSLSDRLVYARFNFGRELEPVTIPATIGRATAAGITPTTDIEVVILDIHDKPFENIRLLYDLFDYNDYRDDNGDETGEVVTDPRDNKLYCRGLKLQYDPTFELTASNLACDQAGETCLYSYAKIRDTGLADSTGFALSVSEPQIDLSGSGYVNDTDTNALKKCLPDNRNRDNFNGVLNLTSTEQPNSPGYGATTVSLNGENYTYMGNFRAIATDLWEVTSNALISDLSSSSNNPTGVFQKIVDINNPSTGYGSFLFPRSGKMNLQTGVEYFGTTTPFVDLGTTGTGRTLMSLVASGDTNYMDGCNLRMMNYDSYSNEGFSSCNVTATIELLTIDGVSGKETVLASNSSLKLQIIRPSVTNYQGKEVLYSSMKTCTNSQACSSDECCYNNRCWSKELVALCYEDVPVVGNLQVGEKCESDFECSSLCCSQTTGACAVHMNTADEQVLCSKTPGQTCVAKEWCAKENVQNCFVVKTGLDTQGQTICALRCYNVPTFGICQTGSNRDQPGRCVPPETPEVPEFDPNEDPETRCEGAVDPPTEFD